MKEQVLATPSGVVGHKQYKASLSRIDCRKVKTKGGENLVAKDIDVWRHILDLLENGDIAEDYEGDVAALARVRWVTRMVRAAFDECNEQIINAKMIDEMLSKIEN